MNFFQSDVCNVVLIGSASRREFSTLVSWLRQNPATRIVGHFKDIGTSLDGWDILAADPEMTVVLQSWSDEFSQSDVNHLIGRTLFQRLLCCFGPWCESDGRNRAVWPDALHVSVRLAESVIAAELHRIDSGGPSIPPTLARDEVFAHRMDTTADGQSLSGLQEMIGAVISPDRVFRKTVCSTLRDYGLRSVHLPLITSRRRIVPKETPRGPIHLVFHDLDPWGELTEDSLAAARRMFPSSTVLGIASMPDAGISTEIVDAHIDAVIPKLDFENGLRWHLKCLLESHRQERVHSYS
ncbi:MAG TPA: hypothetical protein EYG03_29545 [Planctomycetes bacterium]|nr:hypothetical protein [Fuerstiella sp.]HIK96109.1 hypothetical protein [Planctomycetota bacterium]